MIKLSPVYYPMFRDKEKFIILVTGGRGSGKSYSASTFIERLTFEMTPGEKLVHKILYSRYTMVSAEISVIPEFLEKVDADGVSKYFSKRGRDVTNRITGSVVMFRGIKTSSGNQTAKLKSIHGLTTLVVDEAEEWVNEDDFDKIVLSIRQRGIQNRVIVIMNPADSNHFIYRKYIRDTHEIRYYDGVPVQISTHPNVLHIHTTYLDNADNLSEQFLRDVAYMKEKDLDKYAHVVMGRWADVAEGAVFKKWGIVDEFPEYARKQAIGLDFGYTHDPSAAVRCGIVDNRLYIDELFYEKGMTSKVLAATLQRYRLRVIADSADPRLIDEIALGGVVIYPVQKGAGSIEAGIDKMHDLELFVTKRSTNIMNELRNYVWAKDKDGVYINQPEDHDNHAIDAARYYVLGELLGKIARPRKLTRDQLGIF